MFRPNELVMSSMGDLYRVLMDNGSTVQMVSISSTDYLTIVIVSRDEADNLRHVGWMN